MSAAPVDIAISLHRELAALESEWRAFEQCAHCTVFQTFAWLSAWQQHVGAAAGAKPAVVIGRDAGGSILFVMPLAVDRWHSLRRLIWLGSSQNDYNAPLLGPRFHAVIGGGKFLSLWPRILACVRQDPELRFDLVHLVHMPETVDGQPNPMRQLPVIAHSSRAYLAHLAPDWETFYARKRSAVTRRRDRTKRRRLEALGEVRLRRPDAADEIARSFDALVSQKSRSFARRGVPDIFTRPGNAEFYKSLALHPANRDLVHLSRLDVGATVAAVNFGLRFRSRYYHVLASHADGDLSRYGPGAAHLQELMRHAIESRCEVFDFTVGDEPYKRDWCDTEVALFELVAPAGWRGALASWTLQGSTRAKRLVKQAPRLWSALTALRAMVLRRPHRAAQAGGAGDPHPP